MMMMVTKLLTVALSAPKDPLCDRVPGSGCCCCDPQELIWHLFSTLFTLKVQTYVPVARLRLARQLTRRATLYFPHNPFDSNGRSTLDDSKVRFLMLAYPNETNIPVLSLDYCGS